VTLTRSLIVHTEYYLVACIYVSSLAPYYYWQYCNYQYSLPPTILLSSSDHVYACLHSVSRKWGYSPVSLHPRACDIGMFVFKPWRFSARACFKERAKGRSQWLPLAAKRRSHEVDRLMAALEWREFVPQSRFTAKSGYSCASTSADHVWSKLATGMARFKCRAAQSPKQGTQSSTPPRPSPTTFPCTGPLCFCHSLLIHHSSCFDAPP
jgi:hypothetical protein